MPHSSASAGPFARLGLEPHILQGVREAGFKEPTDIQREMIPLILEGRDVLGQARTGTGKTAAFGLPILQTVKPGQGFQALTLVPTRELAVQVAAEVRRLGQFTHLRCVPIYGGQKIKRQLAVLGRKPCIIVGTPGRMLDMLGRGHLALDQIRFAVLDEVDRMLDIGFRDDIRDILGRIKSEHQTIFCSATIGDEIKRLARQFTKDAVEVNVSRDELTVEEVEQAYCTVDPWDKFRLLRLLLRQERPRLAIVFCNTRHAVRKLARRLHDAGVNAKEIHGDLVQQRRERVMDHFRRHKLQVLVATDLAARGIDVSGISHIINYDIPEDPDSYVHRIGRTARMGAFGRAITFVTREQGNRLTEVECLINKEVPQYHVEGFRPSPPPREVRETEAREAEKLAAAAPESRLTSPLHDRPAGGVAEAQAPARPVRKTLGSKFKPARRRRR
jgi:ATP-dependent RNA helicase DeaD